jgi:hypothetical protein
MSRHRSPRPGDAATRFIVTTFTPALLLLVALALEACASEGATPPDADTDVATTIRVPSTVGQQGDATTSSIAPSTTTSPPPIDVAITGTEVSGPDSFKVALGDTVDIWVVSDTADELHVHGYDVSHDLRPGVPLNLRFPADAPGIFEVELETAHIHLFDVEVLG